MPTVQRRKVLEEMLREKRASNFQSHEEEEEPGSEPSYFSGLGPWIYAGFPGTVGWAVPGFTVIDMAWGKWVRSAAHRCPQGALQRGQGSARSQNVTSVPGQESPQTWNLVNRPPTSREAPLQSSLGGREE